jgi:hypothetical protein
MLKSLRHSGQPDALSDQFHRRTWRSRYQLEKFYEMAAITGKESPKAPAPRLLLTEAELTEIRKLQAIAQAKRKEQI